MDKIAKTAIHDLVLSLRKILEAEVERELGRFGIYADRNWIRVDELPRLNEQEKTYIRPRIEAAIQRERDGGMDTTQAVHAFIRETAYTHLNRLLGLKCMEVRGLITETITTRERYSDRSQRHRDYLDEHPDAHRLPDRGLVLMLQDACTQVSQQIGVVFDPDSDYSLVWPRHTVLKECIEAINGMDIQIANRRGEVAGAFPSVYADDTVLGWVYQYFQEEEKARVFAEVNKNKKKIGGADIIPATTAYTERYMVQFLVENSLGALWMEMYPESDLCQDWEYFVEDPNLLQEDGIRQGGRDPMPVSEITLLDPACGSGHFLLYAFDLFAQMYEAEASMQNRRIDRIEIARSILRQNLYGIDIDLRSIQLSALNLYMKACTYAGVPLDGLQNGGAVQMNLVCADIVLKRGHEFNELLARFKGDPLTQSLIQTIWRGLENARELGSLLKIDEEIDELIRRKRQAEKGTFWEHPEELWEQWKKDFVSTLRQFINRASESFDVNRDFFGKEAIKGFQLLDLLTHRYNIVVANPPYMGAGNLSGSVKDYILSHYPDGRSDLYAAFIERLLGLVKKGDILAMITQQTFMFIKSFEALRKKLVLNYRIRSVAHLGPNAFEEITGEKVNTVMFTFSMRPPTEQDTGIYIRLVDVADKMSSLKQSRNDKKRWYSVRQYELRAIPGWPINYWVGHSLRAPFQKLKPLSHYAVTAVGLSTANNDRFIRYWWEIGRDFKRYGWIEHLHGGETQKWYGNLDHIILWHNDGHAIKNNPGATIRNESLYGMEGITWSDVGTVGFSARYQPPGRIWDTSVNALLSRSYKWSYYLGLLNSRLVNFFLDLLNPTFHYLVGDVARLPLAIPSNEKEQVIENLATYCVENKKAIYNRIVTSQDFEMCPLQIYSKDNLRGLLDIYARGLNLYEDNALGILLSEGALEKEVQSLYQISKEDISYVYEFQPVPLADYPVLDGYDSVPSGLPVDTQKYVKSLPKVVYPPEKTKLILNEIQRLYALEHKSIETISTSLQINPISVVALRRKAEIIDIDDFKHEVENLLTHRIWELGKRDPDGILPYDEGLGSLSLLQQVRGEIEALFGADRAVDIETEMDGILGKGGLAAWLGDPFFKKHVSQFKKRPILWQVTSPGKNFRILIYYHKIDHDTLPKVRSLYLWPLLERARTQLRVEKKQAPLELKAIARLEEYIADLEECDRRLESVIQGSVKVNLPEWAVGPYRNGKPPYNPDLNDGVRVNILPLQAAGLLPIKKVVEE